MDTDRPSPPSAPIPRPIGRILEPLYRAALARRNRAFDAGRGVIDLGAPVLSVGNISAGGVGKTPMVMRILRWLLDAGLRPAVAMRGYKARPGLPSDEQALYADRFPDLPIVARPDRVAGLIPLLRDRIINCVVLDDGFQHRRLARALDIVLIDAMRDPFADRCLPAGWLREPVESLRRGGGRAIVLTHAESVAPDRLAALRAKIKAVTGHPPIAETRHEWAELLTGAGPLPIAQLRGAGVIVACAIGNPHAFAHAVEAIGARVHAIVARRDHHHWTPRDAHALADLARRHADSGEPALVLTTEKDWVKLRRLPHADLPTRLAWPRLELAFQRGEPELRELVLACAASNRGTFEPGRYTATL